MSYERMIVLGNVGSAELRVAKGGERYLQLSIATDRMDRDKKVTTWYRVLMFGAMARNEAILDNYTKGRQVLVEGRPQVEAYIKRDGTAGLDNCIFATSMPELVGYR